ncbi:hypothetical protein GE061_002644 [Apolygus lucorum]|uniref:Uncharacterized protein n=1 Tax=Apolygus lucorum TaxID=248454 RepID=A0A8S9X5R1_APOLU|nr:hypothetical protein GE061_002644 [Apolygus lucorum]
MNLLFTKKELREIFKPRTTTSSAHTPNPPTPHHRPSQPKGHGTRKGKPPASSTADLRPMQRSSNKPPQPATAKPPYTIPARKRILTAITSAAHEHVTHNEPLRPRWNIRPIDLPTTRRRAQVVIDYYQAKNARRFDAYIPNFVHPNNIQIADEIGEVEGFEELIHNTITSLLSPRPIPLQTSPSPGPKRRRRRGRKARALLSKLRSGQLLIFTAVLSKKRRRATRSNRRRRTMRHTASTAALRSTPTALVLVSQFQLPNICSFYLYTAQPCGRRHLKIVLVDMYFLIF